MIWHIRMNNRGKNKGPQWCGRAIRGALAEMAFCKWANLYWSGLGSACAPDAGFHFEVRNHAGENYQLEFRPKDDEGKENSIFIFAWGYYDRFVFHGWQTGHYIMDHGKETDFGNGRPTCWALLKDHLKDLREIAFLGERWTEVQDESIVRRMYDEPAAGTLWDPGKEEERDRGTI
ncbi:MAG: hypothetical protein GY937_20125 [bacterium]|nr:hypothetical protein [bacterium]